jgi:LmbE family N-acetylglucosaminyl deacetylase
MNVLIVAHPDDEIIWFSPMSFDLIVIAFLGRHDKPYAKYFRELSIAEHPLSEKIILLGLDEPGFWKDNRRIEQYKVSREQFYNSLNNIKQQYSITKIFTHNSQGEYGHDDHILVNEVVISLFKGIEIFCPVKLNPKDEDNIISVSNNLDFYEQVKAIYCKNKAWTWHNDYLPPSELYYSLYVERLE